MSIKRHRSLWFRLGVIIALAAAATAIRAEPAAPVSLTQRLEHTERIRNTQHARFLKDLAQLRQQANRLSPYQRRYLHYLEAWEAAQDGQLSKSTRMLRPIIADSQRPALTAKARALLLTLLYIRGEYSAAYRTAGQLIATLPEVHDKLARYLALLSLSQLMNQTEQSGLALTYARQALKTIPPGETPCVPHSYEVTALLDSGRLKASSPKFDHAIALCTGTGETVTLDNLQLKRASAYVWQDQPAKAVALIKRLLPQIDAAGYRVHMLSARATLARAYWQLGDARDAQRTARTVLRMDDDGSDWANMQAYKTLYEIAKHQGQSTAALDHYEHYVTQRLKNDKASTRRQLAYQKVRQEVQSQNMHIRNLQEQNKTLNLRQSVEHKAAENSRLYLILLISLLGFVGLWLLRTKQSQRRLRHLACHDGLTGALNHQHFIERADQLLTALGKSHATGCLILMDLDHFKLVNDTHGHAVGDRVLRHTATICRDTLRHEDLFGRLGGEEFGILLPYCSPDDGLAIVERLRARIADPPLRLDDDTTDVPISASFGVALFTGSDCDVTALLAAADEALYEAKAAGRNRVVVFEHGATAMPTAAY